MRPFLIIRARFWWISGCLNQKKFSWWFWTWNWGYK